MGGRGGRGRRRKAGGRGREGAQVEWRAGGKGAREEGAGGRIYRLIISVSWLSTTETHAHVTSHFR